MLHVTPTNDLREHIEKGMECWCEPKMIWGDREQIVVHNSADRREVQEQFEELTNE